MLQSIPTRILGVRILRQTAERRIDGSSVLIRQHALRPKAARLPHEELVTANLGFTCEPSFTRRRLQRTVRCLSGECFVCVVDVRRDSRALGSWQSFTLSDTDGRSLLVPAGVALGWQVTSASATLELRGNRNLEEMPWQWLCWDDPDLQLEWPERPCVLAKHLRSSRDLRTIPQHRLPKLHRTTKQLPPAKGAGSPRPAPAVMTSRPTSPPRILVFGSSGQLGRDLCRALRNVGTVIGASRRPAVESVLPVPVRVDISRPASLRQAIRQVSPTLIVNAASLTDVDACEAQPRLAQLVNATAPAVMAEEAAKIGAGVVHFCSNLVFDGSGERPWRESDQPRPLNQYARSKWVGTQAVLASGAAHLVLRSGWLYSTHGENFVQRLIDAVAYRPVISLANDHVGTPTSTNFLARLAAQLLALASDASHRVDGPADLIEWLQACGGLYHATPLGRASQLEVGDQIVANCRQLALPMVLQRLQGVPSRDLVGHPQLPANCSLDSSRVALKFKLQLPHWQSDLQEQMEWMLEGVKNRKFSGVA